MEKAKRHSEHRENLLKASGKKRHRLKLILILAASLAVGFVAGTYMAVVRGLPPVESIAMFNPPVATKIFDQDNNLVGEFFIERRELTNYSEVPDYLKKGFICIEDKLFYRHWGVDIKALLRSLIVNILHLRAAQGFSTITMQLARNMFLTQEKTLLRKMKEIMLAIRIERAYTKDEILEKYLNQVNFGQGRYGVETAARYYFNKKVKDLNLNECALLIALPKSPESYSPYKYPDRARARRDLVLREMLKDNVILEEDYEKAVQEPLTVVEHKPQRAVGEYFMEELRRHLEMKYGGEFLYRSGANIYTTMNASMQRAAEEVLEKHLVQMEKEYKFKNPKSRIDSIGIDDSLNATPYVQGAVVIIDQHTGEVKALVGGRDFAQSKFNRATQARRQTGSAFKIFVFAAAIDNGFTAADILLDLPIVLEVPGQDSIYRPANYDHRFLGPITLRRALALSRNLVAIRLIRTIGPDLVVRYAHALGIRSPLLPVVSLALGSCTVTLLELTNAFSTIGNMGVENEPIFIRRITDKDGTVIERNEPESERRLSPQISYIMVNLMRAVVDNGTGIEVRKYYKGPAGGKTGTTDNYSDAWFVGFTPKYTAGVWVGFDDNQRIYRGATGGVVSAPIWGDIMKQIDTLAYEEFPVPDNIVWRKICQTSGLIATDYCPKPKDEAFVAGTEPVNKCDVHTFADRIEEEVEFEKIDKSALQGY
jgi:penicillin-binding protein 1A